MWVDNAILLPILNWASLAISLFNTILLFWLGLTIFFNADRYTWGIWLTSGGLLVGSTFFVSHTAILGYRLESFTQELNFWWRLGWIPAIISPLAWYLAMLWYAGFWVSPRSTKATDLVALHHRQRPWFWLITLIAIGLVALFVFSDPLPSYTAVSELNLLAYPNVQGNSLLMVIFPLYILLCIVLSLDVLLNLAPSRQGEAGLTRQRAWPWLVAASIILLSVSLLAGGIVVWVIINAQRPNLEDLAIRMSVTLVWWDLIISGLVGLAIVFIGRAIVSYEVFTGRLLPRRGFFRNWRNVVILAAGYGLMVGWSVTFEIRLIYNLLLITIAMTLFYAFSSWQAFAEHERYINHLRPFVTSQRLFDHLLTGTPPPEVDTKIPFRALCQNVIGAKSAYLIALGPLAPLVGPPLTYPNHQPIALPNLSEITNKFTPSGSICVPLQAETYIDAKWAIPLWSERGLIGVFLLGEKSDGNLYMQEEIEIARASGERLIDTQASAEIARRLIVLQRERLTESQIVDHRTRRVLHDDVLPGLHTAMLTLSNQLATEGNGEETITEAITLLTAVHHQISHLLREMPKTTAPEVAKLGLIKAINRVVEVELAHAFDEVTWKIDSQAKAEIQTIPSIKTEVVFYASREVIRNAAHHGRNEQTKAPLLLHLMIEWQNGLRIVIEDNGVGVGRSQRNEGGSGQGLGLHSTMMAVVGGTLAVESIPGVYTRVSLTLPKEN